MRTTISLNDHLLASAKRRARERGQSLGEVVEDALRRELAEPAERIEPLEVPVFRGGGGSLPGVDLGSNRALAAIAIEHDCELVSFDRDFARFAELRWTRP